MRNLLYPIVLCCLLFSSVAFSQSSCQTAFQDQGFISTPMPPVGTMAQSGPDYGCLSILSRPIWGYFISCDSTFVGPWFEIDQYLYDTVYASIIVWGPFKNKNDVCNNLTASNIFMCEDSILFMGSFFGPNLNFISGPGEFYYYMMATDDTISSNSYTSAHVYSQFGTGNGYICYECNDEVSQMYKRSLCLVTFDSSSQKTKLIWEKVPDTGVDGYVIHRGTQGLPNMDSIAFVSETLSGEFIDYDSHPLQFGEFYRLQPVDSCGNKHNVYDYSALFSIFLQTYPSGNNTVNLNWNTFPYYSNAFEPVLYIHRGASPQNMQIIDTIPVGVTNYTDISAPPGQQFYSVENRRYSACNPLRTSTNTPFLSAMSNLSGAAVTGIPVVANDNLIFLSPVPVQNSLNVTVSEEFIDTRLSIIDVNGRAVFTKFIAQVNEKIDVSSLASGTYWLCISGHMKIVKKIVISR